MSFRVRAGFTAVAVALATASNARAGVGFEAAPFAAPYLSTSSSLALLTVDGAGDPAHSLIGIGSTFEPDAESTLTRFGPVGGGALATTMPLLGHYLPLGVATASSPEPIVVVVGSRIDESISHDGLDVFAGDPLHFVAVRGMPSLYIQYPSSIALTRVASPTDFDFALGSSGRITYWRPQSSTPVWNIESNAFAIATLPAHGSTPMRLAVSAGDHVEIRSLVDGSVTWTSNDTGGGKIVVGTLGTTPAFLVRDPNGGITAYRADPPALLWRNADANAADFSLGDRNGDGALEIAVTASDGRVYWLGSNGAPVGASVTLPYPAMKVAVAKVDAAAARVVTVTDPYTGGDLEVRSLDLGAVIAHDPGNSGPFDAIAIGDLDGGGDDEMASLSPIPWGYPPSLALNSGLVSIRDVATGALLWSSAIPAGLGPTSSDSLRDLAIGRVRAGAARQIVAIGHNTGADFIDIVDGATHALQHLPFSLGEDRTPSRIALVDVDGDGIDEIVLASEPSNSVTTGVRIHVLRAGTLAVEWTSPILTPSWPAGRLATRPVAGGADHLLFAVPQAGVWSIDLAAHFVDYSVAADARAAAWLPGTQRVAIVDADGPALVLLDASSGAALDRQPLSAQTYHAVAPIPGDADRVALAAEDHLDAWNLVLGTPEGRSGRVGNRLALGGALLASGPRLYAGTSIGLWSFATTPFEPLIFADGFEP